MYVVPYQKTYATYALTQLTQNIRVKSLRPYSILYIWLIAMMLIISSLLHFSTYLSNFLTFPNSNLSPSLCYLWLLIDGSTRRIIMVHTIFFHTTFTLYITFSSLHFTHKHRITEWHKRKRENLLECLEKNNKMGRKTIETLEQGFLSFVFGQKIKVCWRLKNICKSSKNR